MSMVSIVEGEEPEDMVSEAIDLLGGIDKFIRFGDVVFIKPNVCGGVVGKRGSYTSPEVIAALIELIKKKACRIIIGEADSEMYDADRMLSETGIRRAAEGCGAEVVNISKGEMVKKVVTDAYMLKEFEKEAKREFKKAPIGIRFSGKIANIFRSLLPEKGLSNFFHNYYVSAVDDWRKKKK